MCKIWEMFICNRLYYRYYEYKVPTYVLFKNFKLQMPVTRVIIYQAARRVHIVKIKTSNAIRRHD